MINKLTITIILTLAFLVIGVAYSGINDFVVNEAIADGDG